MFARFAATSAALSILALASACASPAPGSAPAPFARANSAAAARAGEPIPGELIVRWKGTASPAAISSANVAAGATLLRSARNVHGLQHVRVSPDKADLALAAYRANPNVKYVERNVVLSTSATYPDDLLFPLTWGLENTAQFGGVADADINAPEAWDITTGSISTIIGVIDTGIDYTHPDLGANVWLNPIEDAGLVGVDDDGNGYVDDLNGIDAINGDNDPFDDNFHGTHVSGTIAGVGNDGFGVAGVNWQAQIVACKMLDAGGSGTLAAGVECMDYMLGLKLLGTADVRVTNNSWSSSSFFSQAIEDLIGEHAAADIVFVAAAGNASNDNDASPSYPATSLHPNVISVAATDPGDGMASFSNFGRRTVHLGAPGVLVVSSFPVFLGPDPCGQGFSTSHCAIDGTSMASPHVAGLVGLLASDDPSRTSSQLRNLVLAGAQPTGAMSGTTLTGGRERAFDAAIEGSLNCSTRTVQQRLAPLPDVVGAEVGNAVVLHAMDILCDSPGSPSIDVDVNTGADTVTLLDDGNAPDDFAGDGRYVGTFVPSAAGDYVLDFPWGETQTIQAIVKYVEVSTAYAPRTLVAPTTLLITDETFDTVTPSFLYRFGSSTHSSLDVYDNGFAAPTAGPPPYFNQWVNEPLPNGLWDTVVAPFWDDFDPGVGGAVRFEEFGVAPDRELVVEWSGVPLYLDGVSGDGAFTFQVVLFESH